MSENWILITGARQAGAQRAAFSGGDLIAVVVGARDVADEVAAAGLPVTWIDAAGHPAEAFAASVAALAGEKQPQVVLAADTPSGRVLAGAVAAKITAVLLGGVTRAELAGASVSVQRVDLDGRVCEELTASAPLVGLVAPSDEPLPAGAPAAVSPLAVTPSPIAITGTEAVPGASNGVADADRVVSIGRGLKQKDDLAMITQLAAGLGAEVGCSMPVADDLGWVPKENYVGRSGQHIAPSLYLAIGISGAPQHLEGIRDAKVVAAINSDPDAHIFGAADYGIVGDLYEVVPELITALQR